MYEAELGIFVGIIILVMTYYDLHKTTKELEETEAELQRIEERIKTRNGPRKNV